MNKTKKMSKIEKYTDFAQAGKISVQLDNEYYENGENTKIRKMYDNFCKMLTEKGKLS